MLGNGDRLSYVDYASCFHRLNFLVKDTVDKYIKKNRQKMQIEINPIMPYKVRDCVRTRIPLKDTTSLLLQRLLSSITTWWARVANEN